MRGAAVLFENVGKSYPHYHHITGGFKRFLLNMPKTIPEIRNQRYYALKDIDGEIYAGETIGLIGNNGAGKSTILGLIAGVIKPTTGRVIVKKKVLPLLELGSGFHMELTGWENIYLNGILLGMTRAEVNQRLDEIIEFSELGDFIEQPIRTYSSGMLARLGFSVVISLDPELLLIDEILAVGDMAFQEKCIRRLLAFKKKGVTIVFVSHNLDQVKSLCDRVVWLDQHTIRLGGHPEDIVAEYVKHDRESR